MMETVRFPPQSLWCQWSLYCVGFMPSSLEARSLLGPFPLSRNLLHGGVLGADESLRLRALLRIQQQEIEQATGADLAYPCEARTVLHTEVRYCRECLRLGFHSMLHQHLGVDHCPVHGQALMTGCFECGSMLAKTVEGVARVGLTCGHCAVVFSLPRYQAQVETQSVCWEPMDSLRAALTRSDANPRASWPGTIPTQPSVHARQLLRWTAWTPQGALPAFKEEVTEAAGQLKRQAALETSPVLEELLSIHDMLTKHHQAIADLAGAVGEGCGARIRGVTSVAAAAFYRTCLNYRMRQDLFGRPDLRRTLEFSHLLRRETSIGFVPQWAYRLVAQADVRAIFALTLLRLSRLELLQDVAWNEVPQPNDYGAAWKWNVCEAEEPVFRLRARVGVRTLQRLIGRFGDKSLQANPNAPLRDALLSAQRPSRASLARPYAA